MTRRTIGSTSEALAGGGLGVQTLPNFIYWKLYRNASAGEKGSGPAAPTPLATRQGGLKILFRKIPENTVGEFGVFELFQGLIFTFHTRISRFRSREYIL